MKKELPPSLRPKPLGRFHPLYWLGVYRKRKRVKIQLKEARKEQDRLQYLGYLNFWFEVRETQQLQSIFYVDLYASASGKRKIERRGDVGPERHSYWVFVLRFLDGQESLLYWRDFARENNKKAQVQK